MARRLIRRPKERPKLFRKTPKLLRRKIKDKPKKDKTKKNMMDMKLSHDLRLRY